MVSNHKEAGEVDEVSKIFPVAKFLDQFPTYLKELHGVSKVSFSYMVREERDVPTPLPNLIARKSWGETHNSLTGELIAYSTHMDKNYNLNP